MLFTPPQTPPNNRPIVTVWIHGTKAEASLPAPIARLANKARNAIFQHKSGLNHAKSFNHYSYEAVRASILGTTEPTLFQPEYMYSFGWSGKLNQIARKIASQELFDGLKQLYLEILEKTGQEPEFILIAHSHGGNVVLHLAEIKDPDGFNLVISKAILLACPVQKNTAHLINSPVFERVYSLHSHTDMIQIADMQGLHKKKHERKPFFSERHFDIHPKLVQVCIRWKNGPTSKQEDSIIDEIMLKHLTNGIKMINFIKKNRGLLHVEFILLPFVRHLSSIIAHLDDLFEKDAQCACHKNDDIIIEL
jgi:hypothetical protein